jgi:hypothetical protein
MSKLPCISLPPDPPSSRIKIKNIKELINAIPDDIKMKIYKEYLEPEIYYNLYENAIKTISSKTLNIIVLRPHIPILLSKPLVTKYICKKCNTFRTVYSTHKIENKKNFKKNNKGDSFALSILFNFYH